MTANEDLARKIANLRSDVDGLTHVSNLGNASIAQGEGQGSLNISDVLGEAVDANAIIPGLTDQLAALNEALIANDTAVQAAHEAATQAGIDGIAAGELAGAAADVALEKAQEALDAAAAAGGGATYSGSAPTAATPGTQGQQWFVWDSNYKITAYYVHDSSNGWTLTQITDAVLGNINAGSITSGYISADRIAAASLTAAVLAADTITSREIAANAILARNIKAGEITGTHIAASTITGGKIAANTITAANIAAGTITASEIAANSITANEINLNTLNGKTITGATIKTAASGQRAELVSSRIDFFSPTNGLGGNIQGVDYSFGGSTAPVVAVAGGAYGIVVGGGLPIWRGTKVGLRVSGDTAVKRVMLDPSIASDGYVGGIYGFQRTSATDPTPIPMPLLYAKGASGIAYPDMYLENIHEASVNTMQAGKYNIAVSSSNVRTFASADSTGVTLTAKDLALSPSGISVSARLADGGWQNATAGAYALNSTKPLRYRVRGDQVFLYGQLDASGGVGQTTTGIASVPAAAAPALEQVVQVTGASGVLMRVRIRTDGRIDMNGASGSSTYVIFDGLSYFTS